MTALAAGLLAAGLTWGTASMAPAVPDTLAEIPAGGYTMDDGGSFDTFAPWVSSLDGKLPKASFTDVLADGNRTATSDCRDTGVSGATTLCWEGGDDKAADWYPQGVTGSWDADASGKYAGHRAIMASWYHKGDKGARISLVNYDDPAKPTYRHILLVEPTAGDDFKQVPVHAGGIAWFGDYLYVVDTDAGVRVFDLKHLWRTEPDASKSKIGNVDGKYYAYNYAYALPQVGAYSQQGKGDCDPAPVDELDAPLCYSWVSLDRGDPPSLLTGEFFYGKEKGARLVRWPVDPASGLLGDGKAVTASKAYQTPHISVQGAMSYGGTFLESSSRGQNARSVIHRSAVGEAGSEFTVPSGSEDMSYEPGEGRAWTQTEYPGSRTVIGIPDALG